MDKKIVVKIKKDAGAIVPDYAHEGDAGLDIYANEECILMPGHRKDIGTGLHLEIPKEHAGLVWDKSSLPLKYGIKTMAGVIDSNYRGELKIVLINLSSKEFQVAKGMKIAQLLIQKVERAEIKEVSELSSSERGEKGFGSTGLRKSDLKSIKEEIERR